MAHLAEWENLRIPETSTSESVHQDLELMRRLAEAVDRKQQTMIGFPVNLDFDYRPLADFLTLHLNNAGSPEEASEYGLDTKVFEQVVVDFFIDLAGGSSSGILGHLAHSGSEGNLFAAYLGRERYPEAVLYTSAEAHYSVAKIARILRMPHVPVDTDDDGAMDLAAFRQQLNRRATRPAVVIATIGTTGRGAMDDIQGIRQAAASEGVSQVFVHSDAAFGGPLAAFAEPPLPWAFPAGADSVSVSGHKIIGSPIPSSIVLARRADVDAIRQPDVAVGSDDNTISGSRDALSPIFLWYALRKLGREGLARRVRDCLAVTEYAVERLRAADQHPTRAPGGNVVLFDLPPEDVRRKWHLLEVDGRGHLVVMPHVKKSHIDQLCADLA